MASDPDLPQLAVTRQLLLRSLRRYFQYRRPRVIMSGLLLLTGATGFLVSFTLLKCELTWMWLRYPLALFVAWAVFLGLIRAWAQLASHSYRDGERSLEKPASGDLPDVPPDLWSPSGKGVLDSIDLDDLGDLNSGKGCLVSIGTILLLGLVCVTIGEVISVVTAAPYLISEVFLDAALVAALYKRLHRLDRRSWLESAMRHTAWPVLWTAVMLMILGIIFHVLAPEAKSMRGVWHHYVNQRPASEVEVEAPDSRSR